MLEMSSQYCINVARRVGKRYEPRDATASDHSAIGDASSRIQMLRPCVATTRSFVRGWTRMSAYSVVGRLPVRRLQCAPLSSVTKRKRSVPANSTFGLPGYSAMLRTEASGGSPALTDFHVLPKSVVRRMYGAKSP